MLLVINCQNGYLEKCQSSTLRNIVEAADLMDDVWMLTWRNPPSDSFFKKVDPQQAKPDYDMALYPELAQLPGRRHSMASPTDYSKEMYAAFDQGKEVFMIGANTSDWLVDMAMDLWGSYRIKPAFFHDAWFSVGPKGCHSDANLSIIRRFGAASIGSWESYKAPLVARRQATLAEKAAAAVPAPASEAAAEEVSAAVEEAQPEVQPPHEG